MSEDTGVPPEVAVKQPSARISAAEYIGQVERYLKYYRRRGKLHAFAYYGSTCANIVIAAMIPLIALTKLDDKEILVAVLGAASAVITGVSAAGRVRDRMTSALASKELIATELVKYRTQTSPYDNEKSLQKFVMNVERINLQDLSSWKTLHSQNESSAGN